MSIEARQSAEQEPIGWKTLAATVIVERGVVALDGHLKRDVHELPPGADATRAVHGADDVVEVRTALTFKRVDVQIAQTAAAALRRALPWSHECAQLSVQNGRLTLDGQFEWQYQRERARAAIGSVPDTVTVLDCARVSANADLRQIRARIHEAESATVSGDEALKRTLLSWAAPQGSKPAV